MMHIPLLTTQTRFERLCIKRIALSFFGLFCITSLCSCSYKTFHSAESTAALKTLAQARNGDAQAQFNAGLLAAFASDDRLAHEYSTGNTASNMIIAYYRMGARDDGSQNTAERYSGARVWFEKAASQNYAPAMFHLSLLYEFGRGVPADPAESMMWLTKAADAGYAPAQKRLDEHLSQ